MYSDYFALQRQNTTIKKKTQKNRRMPENMSTKKQNQHLIENNNDEASRIADRALLLLSFKNTPSQNLHHVLQVLGIHSVEEKKSILQEIFRLIRLGIVYVPRGLPKLIDKGIENIEDITQIDLVLLKPYDQLIADIQKDISLFTAENSGL